MVAAARRRHKGPTAGTPCRNCEHALPSGADLCPVCGWAWVPRDHAFWPYHIAHDTILSRPSEAVVLHKLAGFTDYRTGECRPAVGTLMKVTGFNRRTVQRAIRGLIDQKIILVDPRHDRTTGAQRSNAYFLRPDNPCRC